MSKVEQLKIKAEDSGMMKEYPRYKIELVVEHDELQTTLEAIRYYGIAPAIYYQVS